MMVKANLDVRDTQFTEASCDGYADLEECRSGVANYSHKGYRRVDAMCQER